MSSQDQPNKEQKTDTNAKFYPLLILLVFVSVIGAIIFLLKDRLTKHFEKNDSQSDSSLSHPTGSDDDETPQDKTSDEVVSESDAVLKEIENFVAPESIPDKLER